VEGKPGSRKFPDKCRQCAKASGSLVHGACNLCQDINFQERVLCDLNRRIQDRKTFECYSFRPASVPKVETLREGPKGHAEPPRFKKLLDSDSFKYDLALGLQKLKRSPDAKWTDLRYHLVWTVARRKQAFAESARVLDVITNAFSDCADRIGGFASVLWLAPDHLHVYVESDGEHSIETIVQELKRASAQTLRKSLSDRKSKPGKARGLWDKAYFAETVD